MKKPNFFILGAPRCGTTSLYHWLEEHQNVYLPCVKEPHFFSNDIPKETPPVQTFKEYLGLFSDAGQRHKAVGEASTNYLASRLAVPRIEKAFSNPKYIVCLRNPAEMAYSLHRQLVYWGKHDIEKFSEAWRCSYSIYEKIKDERHYPEKFTLCYHIRCNLAKQVNRLMSKVDRSRVLFVSLSNLNKNPLEVYKKILHHISLKYKGKKTFNKSNTGKKPISTTLSRLINRVKNISYPFRQLLGITGTRKLRWMYRLNSKGKKKGKKIDKHMKREIMSFFEKDLANLDTSIRKYISNWQKI